MARDHRLSWLTRRAVGERHAAGASAAMIVARAQVAGDTSAGCSAGPFGVTLRSICKRSADVLQENDIALF